MSETISVVQQTPKTYDFTKDRDILNISEVYTEVARLDVPYREVGVYEFKLSFTFNFTSINTSAFYRWRFNGGTWQEFSSEQKDKTDNEAVDYFYPVEWTGGKLLVEVQMKKETANGTLNLYFHDIIWERKG